MASEGDEDRRSLILPAHSKPYNKILYYTCEHGYRYHGKTYTFLLSLTTGLSLGAHQFYMVKGADLSLALTGQHLCRLLVENLYSGIGAVVPIPFSLNREAQRKMSLCSCQLWF